MGALCLCCTAVQPFRQLTAEKFTAKHSARFKPAQAHREDDLTTMITSILFMMKIQASTQ